MAPGRLSGQLIEGIDLIVSGQDQDDAVSDGRCRAQWQGERLTPDLVAIFCIETDDIAGGQRDEETPLVDGKTAAEDAVVEIQILIGLLPAKRPACRIEGADRPECVHGEDRAISDDRACQELTIACRVFPDLGSPGERRVGRSGRMLQAISRRPAMLRPGIVRDGSRQLDLEIGDIGIGAQLALA